MHDADEQERIEALKAWWNKNSRLLSIAILAVLVVVAGASGWRYYQAKQNAEAALLYGALLDSSKARELKRTRQISGELIEKYAATVYAPRAALVIARDNFEAGDMQSAKAQLQWAIMHGKQQEIQDLARLRLAAILLDEKKYNEALSILNAKHGTAFAGLYADLRGDILKAQGKDKEASQSYQLALNKMPPQAAYRQLVQFKLEALSGK